MGTGYRSAFDMDQNQTRLIIDTDEHPGFYIISLIKNGTILTTRYINAGNIPMNIGDIGQSKYRKGGYHSDHSRPFP